VFLIVPRSPWAYEASLFPDQQTPTAVGVANEIEAAQALAEADPGAAAEALRRLLDRAPTSSRARFALAQCLQRMGRFEDANAEFVAVSRGSVFAGYEAIVRRVAAREGVALVDLSGDFTALRREPLYVDDMHPDVAGHETIARRLYERLEAGL
jgi:lysophospholipase L1-like esterase